MDKELESIILNWICLNYGPQEAENPCYDIEGLVKYIMLKYNLSRKEVE